MPLFRHNAPNCESNLQIKVSSTYFSFNHCVVRMDISAITLKRTPITVEPQVP